jgi:hypothetical protein
MNIFCMSRPNSSNRIKSCPDISHRPGNHPVFSCVVERAGQLVALAARKGRAVKKARTTALRCECHHAKSIHARMYANPKLGTSCNYPGCRCKAYKAGPSGRSAKARR